MDDMKKSLEDLEKEVICGVCLEYYTEPKALPCMHYYCKKCILDMALKKTLISCPECRKETKITPGEEDNLPTAHFVYRLKDLHTRQEKAMSKEIQCESCLNPKAIAVAYCKQCKKFICSNCKESHSLMKAVFEGHEMISVSEGSHLNIENYTANSSFKKCRVHDEPLKLYCYQCKKIICLGCIVIDHKDHKVEFNSEAAGKKKKLLLEKLKSLSYIEGKFGNGVKDVDIRKTEIDARGVELSNCIQDSFKKLEAVLLQHKEKLLKDVNEVIEQKKVKLSTQKDSLSMSKTQVHSIIEYTRHCVQHCSDNEIMSEHEHIVSKIEEETEKRVNIEMDIRPVEEVDMKVEVKGAEVLQEFLDSNAILIKFQPQISPLPATEKISLQLSEDSTPLLPMESGTGFSLESTSILHPHELNEEYPSFAQKEVFYDAPSGSTMQRPDENDVQSPLSQDEDLPPVY